MKSFESRLKNKVSQIRQVPQQKVMAWWVSEHQEEPLREDRVINQVEMSLNEGEHLKKLAFANLDVPKRKTRHLLATAILIIWLALIITPFLVIPRFLESTNGLGSFWTMALIFLALFLLMVVIPKIYEKEKFFAIAVTNRRLILGLIKRSDRLTFDLNDRSLERWDITKTRSVLLTDVKKTTIKRKLRKGTLTIHFGKSHPTFWFDSREDFLWGVAVANTIKTLQNVNDNE